MCERVWFWCMKAQSTPVCVRKNNRTNNPKINKMHPSMVHTRVCHSKSPTFSTYHTVLRGTPLAPSSSEKNQKTSPEIRRRRSTRTGVQNLRQVGFALSNKKALARLYIKLEVDNGTYDTAYAIPHPLTMYLNALLVLAIACVTHQ